MKKASLLSFKRKIGFYFIIAVLSCNMLSVKAQSEKNPARKYIKAHSSIAMDLMKKTGVPASVILGVAMVESSLGRSKNSKVLNNHFGIIGKNDKSEKLGYHSDMRQFRDAEASYQGFVKVVTSKSFYEKLKGSLDFSKWLTNLNKAGYCATDGQGWMRDIKFFIRKYSLDRYDKLANWEDTNVDWMAVLNR